MKTPLFVILFLLVGLSSRAQSAAKSFGDFDYTKIESEAKGFASVDDAKQIIEDIISVVGLKPKFEIKEAKIPNAAAVVYAGKRFILYNPSFVSALNRAAGNQWASVSIIAHEIGHHLNGHTLEAGGSRPDIELEADEFSGFVLKKMGATLQEAQVAMKIAASQKASHTHPAQADRLYAIAKGWNSASNQMTGKNTDVASIYKKPEPAKPQVQQRTQTGERPQVVVQHPPVVRTTQSPIADKYILKDVHFPSDRASRYYVTVRSNLVKVTGNSLAVVGKLVASNNQQYPLAIVGDKSFLLVSRNGSIVTRSGQKIGYISEHN